MKVAEQNKTPSVLGIFLLFALVGLFLSVESRAETTGQDLAQKIRQPLGPGSLIEFMDDFDFGLSREKRFCDGQDAGFFRNIMSTDCCTIRIHPLDAPFNQHIVIGRGLRQVKDVSANRNFALIDGKYEVLVNCGERAPSAELLKRSLGTRIQIHEMKTLTAEKFESADADAGTTSVSAAPPATPDAAEPKRPALTPVETI